MAQHDIAEGTGTSEPHRPVRQLRLIIETHDFDEAVRFYRAVLGMPERIAFATEGDDRVAILHAGIATIELATPTHARAIDEVEGAPTGDGPMLRLALEVDDTERAVAAAREHGPSCSHPRSGRRSGRSTRGCRALRAGR